MSIIFFVKKIMFKMFIKMPGPYSKYNTGYYINYSQMPSFLTSNWSEGPYTSDVSLAVSVTRNITNNKGNLTRGNAYYNINFQCDSSKTVLTGPFTVTQKFTDDDNNLYGVIKSGLIVQQLNAPVNQTNYNEGLVERVDFQNDIVQSVVIEDVKEKKVLTFTNVKTSNKTDFKTLNTRYVLSFDNAVLTGVVPY